MVLIMLTLSDTVSTATSPAAALDDRRIFFMKLGNVIQRFMGTGGLGLIGVNHRECSEGFE